MLLFWLFNFNHQAKKVISTGFPSVFGKFSSGSQISFRFLKVHIFGSNFSLKLTLRLNSVLNSLKTLKKYCKAASNVFLSKKNNDDNFLYLYGRFFGEQV